MMLGDYGAKQKQPLAACFQILGGVPPSRAAVGVGATQMV